MAHLSWYRKYRPQTFEDVVGQPHIEQTLRNAVAEGAVAHAYLFTGPRGTGKTTTARILAKALECEQGPTPTPDDTCAQCRAITAGQHPDVVELDAASQRGIDDVREHIIGRVSFMPTQGTWKVYVIDEVHMLTTPAFNALLKTFEEPPPHTVFVLCTTDPHKVPETIHSRCQRFDFRRLSVDDIAGRLRYIGDAEGVTVDDGALALIAKHALGGMRDAITTFEQLASFGGGVIEIADVEGLLGEVDADLLFKAAEVVLERDVVGAFRLVAQLAEAGIDMAEFVKGLVRHFRDIYVDAAAGAEDTIDLLADDRARLASQAGRFGAPRAGRVLDVLGRLSSELRYAADQRLAVEVALTRMARPHADLTLESLAERLEALEAGAPIRDTVAGIITAPTALTQSPAAAPTGQAAQSATKTAPSSPAQSGVARPPAKPSERGAGHTSPRGAAPTGALDVAMVKRAWPAVLAEFKKVKASRSHLFNGTEVEVAGDAIAIEFPAEQNVALDLAREPETLALLKRCFAVVLGVEPAVEFRLGRAGMSSGMVVCDPEPPTDAAPAGSTATAPDSAPGAPVATDPPVAPATTGELGASAAPAAGVEDDLESIISELGAEVVGAELMPSITPDVIEDDGFVIEDVTLEWDDE